MIQQWLTTAFRVRAQPVEEIVGAKTAAWFASLNITTVGELLSHIPRRYLSGTELTDLSTLREGEYAAVMARVTSTSVRMGSRQPRLEAVLTDGTGFLNVTFFGRAHLVKYWESELSKGVRGIFVGKIGSFRNERQLAHPQFVMLDARGAIVGSSEEKRLLASVSQSGLVGMYPATAKLPTWQIAESVRLGLAALDGAEDPWPQWVRRDAEVVTLSEAYQGVHRPTSMSEVDAGKRRLRFDEAFSTQLTMAYRRAANAHDNAVPRTKVDGGLVDQFVHRLPYRLTAGQQQVVQEILTDLSGTTPMQRLLQGEVGSGKTVVALMAMLTTVDAGGQAVLLAPTEILATQHYATITSMLGELGHGGMLGAPDHATNVTLLTGSLTTARRREALLRIASGEAGLIIGTHALLSAQVQFADLGLIVVDEQHRFGVEQRAALSTKAIHSPHRIVLTATPIPRSVAMTIFGDLSVSTLSEVPAGRAQVSTTVVDAINKPLWVTRAWERVREEVSTGRQVFIIAPRIDTSSDDPQAWGVLELAQTLSDGELSGVSTGVVHGKQPADVQADTMRAFSTGDISVLFATTVVEVGVDVPNASMMIVFDADRFGISQLHQLRGRIGRGAHPGVCLLLTRAEAGTPAWDRLFAVASTTDGFVLADVDLEQRREGDILGHDQSGHRSGLRLLSVVDDADIIALAQAVAVKAAAEDPDHNVPGFRDAVAWIDSIAADDWAGTD